MQTQYRSKHPNLLKKTVKHASAKAKRWLLENTWNAKNRQSQDTIKALYLEGDMALK